MPLSKARELPADSPSLLFFSTRQGRQTNCVLTVEVARYVAERLGRRLVLPLCHTSPLGPQACSSRPEIPSQRQSVVPFALDRALQPRDLSRCTGPAASALPLLHTTDVMMTANLRNATCLSLTPAGKNGRERARNECALELSDDEQLRTQLALRFSSQLSASVSDLNSGALASRLPPGDVYLAWSFSLFSVGLLGKPFGACALPRETEGVALMRRQLERTLGFRRNETLCVHWRGEDFHHPTTLARHRSNASSSDVADRWVVPLARKHGLRNVLLLSNVRYESLEAMLGSLHGAGLGAESPRRLTETPFGCRLSYVYAVYAEMSACSRSSHFLGSPRSSFSQHIMAMRKARATGTGTEHWMSAKQQALERR